MGLHFADHGLADNREVVIFFNMSFLPLARKGLADSIRIKDMPPINAMIATLLRSGVKMVVCPMCAQIMGVKADELVPGIEMIKDRKQIFDRTKCPRTHNRRQGGRQGDGVAGCSFERRSRTRRVSAATRDVSLAISDEFSAGRKAPRSDTPVALDAAEFQSTSSHLNNPHPCGRVVVRRQKL